MRGARDKREQKDEILRVPAGEIEIRVRRDYWRTVRRAVWRRLSAAVAEFRRRRAV